MQPSVKEIWNDQIHYQKMNKTNVCILIIACALVTGITIVQDGTEYEYLRNTPTFSSSSYFNSSSDTNDATVAQHAPMKPISLHLNDEIALPRNPQEEKSFITVYRTTNENTTSEINQHDIKDKTENTPKQASLSQQLSASSTDNGKATQNENETEYTTTMELQG